MAKLKSGTRIYGTATIDTSVVVGSAVTLSSSGLQVTGNSLITGISTVANLRITPVGTGATVGGIGVTYYGDGSQLTGISASGGISISTNTTNQAQFITYAISTGSTTGLGVSTTKLVFNPSSGNLGIGTTNPQYILTVTDTGTPATTALTNCLADFTTTANSYGQINLRNTSTGTNASSDIIVTADTGTDSSNFIDLGINNSGFSVGSWTINGPTDGYLYTSDTNLSIGVAAANKYLSFFTGGTLISNERMRVNATGVGIGTTNPQSTLHVQGQFQSTQANNTATGGGQIYLNGATGNRIDFANAGVAAPTFTTRSVGTKIALYSLVGASSVDYGFGVESSALWSSVESSIASFKWYAGTTNIATLFGTGELVIGTTTKTGTASQPLQVTGGASFTGVGASVGIGTTNPSQTLHVQGNARVTGAVYDSTNSPGTSGQVLQSTVTGTQWTTAAGGGSGKFDTTIDNVLYVQPTGTLDIVGVGTTTTQITTLPSGSNKYLVHSIHVTNISNGDAEITAGFIINSKSVPASISVSAGSSGGAGIHTFTVGSASSITVGMAVTGTGNIGETTGIGSTAGFQYNTYVTSVDGNTITLSKPMSGYATGTLRFSPISKVASRLPVPVGSAVELLKQPMVLNALDSIVLQSTGAGSGIGSTSTAAISQTSGSNFLTVTAGAAITNFLTSGMLIQPTGSNTGIQTNTFVGVGYTPGSLSIPITRPATTTIASTSFSFTEVVVPEDGALQATIVYQSSTDTAYNNGTGTVVGIVTLASQASSLLLGITSTTPSVYYSTGTTYPSIIQSIRVSNISDGSIYPGGDYPVWVGIGNSDTVFSWLAYNMVIPKNSSIELCEAPKRIGIGQSIFAYSNTPGVIEIQVAGKQKTS